MTAADSYRARAAEVRTRAASDPSNALAAEWEHLAKSYIRLAEQADRNSFQDLWFEFGPKARLKDKGEGT